MLAKQAGSAEPKPRQRLIYIRERLKELKIERDRLQEEMKSLKPSMKATGTAKNPAGDSQ